MYICGNGENMKKLLFVCNNMNMGGVQKSLCNLLWELEGLYDVTLVLFSQKGPLLKELPAYVKLLPVSGPFSLLGISQGECKGMPLRWLLRGFFALITRLFGRNAAIALMYPFQRKVPGQYDCAIAYRHSEKIRSFYGGVNEFVLRKVRAGRKLAFVHCDYATSGASCAHNDRAYAQFDAIAACSAGCRDSFLQCLPRHMFRCFVVRNCSRFDVLRQMAVCNPISYEPGYIHLLTVARLSWNKGVHRVLPALAEALSQGIPVRYHVVGAGKERPALEAEAKKLGLADCVLFHGEQSNPYGYMAGADLLVIPSYHEAAPMVIDEALSLGLPVLSVETTSAYEMVAERGGGWVCPNESKALERCLLAVLKDEAGLKHKRAVLESMHWSNVHARREFIGIVEDEYGKIQAPLHPRKASS